MSFLIGYTIPGSKKGQALTLPDFCYNHVTEIDACQIAEKMRQHKNGEPTWQSIRGALIRIAKIREKNT